MKLLLSLTGERASADLKIRQDQGLEVIHVSDARAIELRAAFSPPPPLDAADAAAMAMGWNAPIATLTDLRVALEAIAASFCGALVLMRPRFIFAGDLDAAHMTRVVLTISVPDRDRGFGTEVGQLMAIPLPILGGELLRIVRAELGRLLLHELAEGIVVAGIRPFDPHR
jgi:hypothetical protein